MYDSSGSITKFLVMGSIVFLILNQIAVYSHETAHKNIAEYTSDTSGYSCVTHIGFMKGYLNCSEPGDYGDIRLHALHEIVSYNITTLGGMIFMGLLLVGIAILTRGEK